MEERANALPVEDVLCRPCSELDELGGFPSVVSEVRDLAPVPRACEYRGSREAIVESSATGPLDITYDVAPGSLQTYCHGDACLQSTCERAGAAVSPP